MSCLAPLAEVHRRDWAEGKAPAHRSWRLASHCCHRGRARARSGTGWGAAAARTASPCRGAGVGTGLPDGQTCAVGMGSMAGHVRDSDDP